MVVVATSNRWPEIGWRRKKKVVFLVAAFLLFSDSDSWHLPGQIDGKPSPLVLQVQYPSRELAWFVLPGMAASARSAWFFSGLRLGRMPCSSALARRPRLPSTPRQRMLRTQLMC